MAAGNLTSLEVPSNAALLCDANVVLTLPFDHDQVEQLLTGKALQRTRERWSWYAVAQNVNPSLGTLSYLPYEIRQMIFLKTLESRPTISADGAWEYDHRLGSPLNVSAYYFGENSRAMIDHRISGLRQVSSPIKAEYEDALLCQRTFRFNDPESLGAFIDRLSDAQKKRVFSIAIGVCILYQMEGWLEILSRLPSNLNDVQFQIYTIFNDYFQPDSLDKLKEMVQVAGCRAPDAAKSICGVGEQPLNPQCMDFAIEIGQSHGKATTAYGGKWP